jgi:Fur family transcriptional regulator, ferric uptake regulator
LFPRRELLKEAKSKGVRLTGQRRALIEAIQQAGTHLDVKSLLVEARKRDPKIDRATAYRTVLLLKRLGMIDELDRMQLHREKHYYEVKSRQDHAHVACLECGAMVEFATAALSQLKQEIAAAHEYEIRIMRLEAEGLCSV